VASSDTQSAGPALGRTLPAGDEGGGAGEGGLGVVDESIPPFLVFRALAAREVVRSCEVNVGLQGLKACI